MVPGTPQSILKVVLYATQYSKTPSLLKGQNRLIVKKLIVWLVMILLNTVALKANNWVKSFGDKAGDVVVEGVATDTDNNVIITGIFSSAQLELNETTTLQNNGTYDVFVIKYNPLGEIIWTQSFGGINEEYVNDISIDKENNIYVTGNFKSNTFKVDNTTVTSSWPDNVYVAKFDLYGDLKWLSHSEKVTNWVWGTAVHSDDNHNIYITGYTNSRAISFGDLDLSLNTLNYKGFYCRLDAEGNFEMAGLLGDEGEDRYQLNDITSGPDGNIYLAGKKTIRTDPDPVTYSEYRDIMYICKADYEGEIIWSVEDTAFHWAEKIIYNQDSLVVLGNREEYRFIFNGGTIDTTSSFYYGVFDVDANKLWGNEVIGALAYDAYAKNNSIVIIGGVLLDRLDLGGFQIQRNSDSSSICPIYQDIFYFESDKSGHVQRVESISGSLEDIATGIWMSDSGDLLYTGTFESYLLSIEANDVINASELTIFNHVSGTYYDRRPYSFLARISGFSSPVGFNNFEEERFRIYPNPSSGMIHIKWSPGPKDVLIKVHDITGKRVYEKASGDQTIQIDLSDHRQGMYVISFVEKNRVVNRPVLIIK